MRILVNLLSNWCSHCDIETRYMFDQHDVKNNIFNTSSSKSQNIRDILSDGNLFHLFRSYGLPVIIITDSDVGCEEYDIINS